MRLTFDLARRNHPARSAQLALIAGDLASLKRAMKRDRELAQAIVDGEVLYGDDAKTLAKYASIIAKTPLPRKAPSTTRARPRRAAS